MKKFDFKSIVVGLVIGIIGFSIVFAAGERKLATISEKKVATVPVAEETEGIKSANINNDKVYFNGNEIKLKNPLVTIVKDGSSEAQLYMPMSELLEYMHFKVEWNSDDSSVYLTMNGQNNQKNMEVTPDISKNQADTEAIEIIQKTGNWSYIEKYIPDMSSNGIERAVEIYNSKHINISEHKKASDYIKN
ncbi:hypothetical protein [Clostridium uliginosum]|uniref:Copper amine oxidase N-terminal domain-containing protein n=1 Tax=Clostridium uliginosum TaxID=119641 RepID=A0A1I1QRN7_9CLOT|nr:hypothetical protein [Clostridium uliginosum]SFD24786.1 hypothetical protein SAMN05421842_1272 [Clostridium uliginosum]